MLWRKKDFSNIVFLLYIINGCCFPDLPYRAKWCFRSCEDYKDCFYNKHSTTGKNRLYDDDLTHEQRMLLAKASCSLFVEARIVKNSPNLKTGTSTIYVTSFIKAIEDKNMNIAESLLDIMLEQDCYLSCIGKFIHKEQPTVPFLISYLFNHNAKHIVEKLIKNKIKWLYKCVKDITNDQIKTIVTIYCDIFKNCNPWDEMKEYLFLHNAVYNNELDLVKFLLKKGADINLLSDESSGDQPIAYALENQEMYDFFIKKKKKLQLKVAQDIEYRMSRSFSRWLSFKAEKNVMKVLDKGLFTDEYTLYEFICKIIEAKNRFDLFKCALNQYKKLKNNRSKDLYCRAIKDEKKEIACYLLENDCHIDLFNSKEYYDVHSGRLTFFYTDAKCLKYNDKNKEESVTHVLKVIDGMTAINYYEKNKKEMSSDDCCFLYECAKKANNLNFFSYLEQNSDAVRLLKFNNEAKRFIKKLTKKDICILVNRVNKDRKNLRLIE